MGSGTGGTTIVTTPTTTRTTTTPTTTPGGGTGCGGAAAWTSGIAYVGGSQVTYKSVIDQDAYCVISYPF
ncbi:hypothetical protein BDZ94DRAFT_1265833 [Collybia nuda]|uniref:Uncharacterized protein n=1 Tax=Collybia nuda TaxID=64659 RepID=A0A9P5XZM5_9AGAR|nr:hypothetical protein BDZ94DRAFT_1265833 [Collybia nuda]